MVFSNYRWYVYRYAGWVAIAKWYEIISFVFYSTNCIGRLICFAETELVHRFKSSV